MILEAKIAENEELKRRLSGVHSFDKNNLSSNNATMDEHHMRAQIMLEAKMQENEDLKKRLYDKNTLNNTSVPVNQRNP